MGSSILRILAYLGSGALSALLLYLKEAGTSTAPSGTDATMWGVIITLVTAVVSYVVSLKKPADSDPTVPSQTEIRRGKGGF